MSLLSYKVISVSFQDIPCPDEKAAIYGEKTAPVFNLQNIVPIPQLVEPLIGLKAFIHCVGQPPLAWMKEFPLSPSAISPLHPVGGEELATFAAPTQLACGANALSYDEILALGSEFLSSLYP